MDYQDRNTFLECAKKIGDALAIQPPVALPQPPVDLTPIADAIRDGLGAIATAIEYSAQLKGRE